MPNNKTIILGSGLGGLSAAIWEKLKGREVTVIEKNAGPGGKVATHSAEGFTFDIGPTLLTMPFVFEELFEAAGRKLEEYVEIYELDVICRYFWEDGAKLDAKHDIQQMSSNISILSSSDSSHYQHYLDYSKEIYELTKDIFLLSPFSRLEDYFNASSLKLLPKLYKLDAWRTVHEANKSFFSDPRIVQLFDRYATYNGSNPYKAPATLNIIPFVEYGLGSFGIRGGTRKLAEAMHRLAVELGVEFRFGEEVQKIEEDGKLITSIRTDKEEFNTSDQNVIANMDVVETYRRFLDRPKKYKAKLEKIEPSLSGYIMCWGVEGEYDKLSLHNILFSEDYEQEFRDIFENRKIPEDPTFYISISSRHAAGDAPEGSESWFILVNAPYLPTIDKDNEAVYVRLKAKLFDKLRKAGIYVEDKIKYEHWIDQAGLYKRYGSNMGSIYGTSSNSQFAAFKRPSVSDPNYRNLFFCGGSSHPGGGMPLVALSGKHASTMVDKK